MKPLLYLGKGKRSVQLLKYGLARIKGEDDGENKAVLVYYQYWFSLGVNSYKADKSTA